MDKEALLWIVGFTFFRLFMMWFLLCLICIVLHIDPGTYWIRNTILATFLVDFIRAINTIELKVRL